MRNRCFEVFLSVLLLLVLCHLSKPLSFAFPRSILRYSRLSFDNQLSKSNQFSQSYLSVLSASQSKYLPSFRHMKRDPLSSLSIHFFKLVGKSAKYVVSFVVTGLLLADDSPLPLYYVTSAVLNSLFGKILKNIIKQPRPMASKKRGYGMPSSHTTAISFFITAILLRGSTAIADQRLRRTVNISALLYGVLACYWRIESKLHTTAQIIAGGVLGTATAALTVICEERVLQSLTRTISLLQERTEIPVLFSLKLGMITLAGTVVFSRNLYFLFSSLLSPEKKKDQATKEE